MARLSKKNKKVKREGNPDNTVEKQAISSNQSKSLMHETPGWSFNRILLENKWTLTKDELFDCNEHGNVNNQCILSKLSSYEGMTWAGIISARHSKKWHTKSHYIKVDDYTNLHADAQFILEKYQIDNLFSLRLKGEERIYGILNSRVLEVLWHDPNHEIWPMK